MGSGWYAKMSGSRGASGSSTMTHGVLVVLRALIRRLYAPPGVGTSVLSSA